jgi:hypothetical protein
VGDAAEPAGIVVATVVPAKLTNICARKKKRIRDFITAFPSLIIRVGSDMSCLHADVIALQLFCDCRTT